MGWDGDEGGGMKGKVRTLGWDDPHGTQSCDGWCDGDWLALFHFDVNSCTLNR